MRVEIFPAFFRENAQGQVGEVLLIDGESSCFYHANKRAALPCQGCGRFLCALCDCELNGQHFCPACIEIGKAKGKIKNLESQRTLYDSVALSLAVYPVVSILFWFFTIVTAPMALIIAICYWNAPRSIVRHTKIRYVLAIVFASIEIVTWGIGIYAIVGGSSG